MNKAFQTALSYVGLKEDTSKTAHNPEILKFFEIIGQEWVKNDETAWCAAFVNACLVMNQFEQTGELTARSLLTIGEPTETPTQGDIVVFWRSSPNSWKGHVGFYVSEDDKYIYCLGGNQSNMVSVSPYKKSQLLGYRSVQPNNGTAVTIDDKIAAKNIELTKQIENLKNEILNLRDDLASEAMKLISIQELSKEIVKLSE